MGDARMPAPSPALDHESTIVAAVELSARSWLVGAQVAGVPRQCRQKLAPSAAALLEHLGPLPRRAAGGGEGGGAAGGRGGSASGSGGSSSPTRRAGTASGWRAG